MRRHRRAKRPRSWRTRRQWRSVTGQQAGLFGGPLYTLLKAVTAIRVAARASRDHGITVVPVFWIDAEDHDWNEIASCGVLDATPNWRRDQGDGAGRCRRFPGRAAELHQRNRRLDCRARAGAAEDGFHQRTHRCAESRLRGGQERARRVRPMAGALAGTARSRRLRRLRSGRQALCRFPFPGGNRERRADDAARGRCRGSTDRARVSRAGDTQARPVSRCSNSIRCGGQSRWQAIT